MPDNRLYCLQIESKKNIAETFDNTKNKCKFVPIKIHLMLYKETFNTIKLILWQNLKEQSL